MKKLPKLLLAVGMMTVSLEGAQAQAPDHIHAAKTDKWRNNLWPMPFRAQDSLAVTRVFDVQRNNGWRMYNTLGTPMFHPESNQLTDAGKAHLRWIMTYAPENRRVVFVLKGPDAEQTARRVESTQVAISELVPVGNLPQIYLTDVEAIGSSGVYQTAVNRALVGSVPAPRLGPAPAGAGSGSGKP